MSDLAGLSLQVKQYLDNLESGKALQEVVAQGVHTLPVVAEFLHEDMPIDRAERLEGLLKAILRAILAKPVSGCDARDIARFQQQLGFILKYKSYTVKASTPVGYSIF